MAGSARVWVRGTGQAGRTSPAGWTQQGRSRGSICVCCTIPTVRSLLLTPARPLGSFSGDSRPPALAATCQLPGSACPRKALRRPHEGCCPLRSPPTARVASGRLLFDRQRKESKE